MALYRQYETGTDRIARISNVTYRRTSFDCLHFSQDMRGIGTQFCDRCVYFGARSGFSHGESVVRFSVKLRGKIVKAHPFHQCLAVDLTPTDFQALLHIKDGVSISAALRTRLEALYLIEKGLNGWRLTDQGSYLLVTGQGWHPSHHTRPDQLSN